MSQVMPKRSFGYSARALFGKDHRRSPDRTVIDEDDFLPLKREISEGTKKLLRYICILQDATGKQFDNVLGRLHWMLKTSGSALEDEDEESVDEAFNTLRDIVMNKEHSHASRWKIMELLELRANEWEGADSIAEYYEDPANFMIPNSPHAAINNNNNLPKYPPQGASQPQHDISPGLRRPIHPKMGPAPYSTTPPTQNPRTMVPAPYTTTPPTQNPRTLGPAPYSTTPPTQNPRTMGPAPYTTTPLTQNSRTRTPSGDSGSHQSDGSRSRQASGGSSGGSRTGSSGGVLSYSRRNSAGSSLSRQSSRKSMIDEDVFHDAADSFPGSDSSGDESDVTSNSSSSVSPAQYRLLHVNSGKPIKYTRTFLLGCWSSPLCKVMPSNIQHTIMNSDIAYIIKGPPFEDPVHLIEHTLELDVFPPQRSVSLPAEPVQKKPFPDVVDQSNPGHVRAQSAKEQYTLGGTVYYDSPPIRFRQEPILHKETFQRLFKTAIEQLDK